MDQEPVTKADLKEATDTIVDRIIARVALREDVEGMQTRLATLDHNVSTMISGQDKYLKKAEGWKHEQDVLAAQHKKLKTTLIRKSVVSEQELAV